MSIHVHPRCILLLGCPEATLSASDRQRLLVGLRVSADFVPMMPSKAGAEFVGFGQEKGEKAIRQRLDLVGRF